MVRPTIVVGLSFKFEIYFIFIRRKLMRMTAKTIRRKGGEKKTT